MDSNATTTLDATVAPVAAAQFHGVLIIQGQQTVDGRIIEPGALTWRELPLPLMWQFQEPQGGGHADSVIVGRIEQIQLEGDEYRFNGTWDTSTQAVEAMRLVDEQVMRWISADLEIIDAEVQMEGDCQPGDTMPILLASGCEPVLHIQKARITGGTVVAFPALPDAVILPAGSAIPAATPNGRPAGDAPVGLAAKLMDPHAFMPQSDSELCAKCGGQERHWMHQVAASVVAAVSEKSWDGSASRFTDAEWKAACAACEGSGAPPKTDCYLPHHEPGSAVSRAGVHAAAQRYPQTQRKNKEVASKHLRGHYKNDLGEKPPPILALGAIVAGVFPVEPPAEWFDNPNLPELERWVTITDEGRIYGHLAGNGECHIGIVNQCVTVDELSIGGFDYATPGHIVTADGARMGVMPLAIKGGHADIKLDWRRAQAHYDDPSVAPALVAVGTDEWGVWFSGAMKPDATRDDVYTLRAHGVSGDWREIGGELRLVGACSVNTPGFPKIAARVASGELVALVAAGGMPLAAPTCGCADTAVTRLARLEEQVAVLRRDRLRRAVR